MDSPVGGAGDGVNGNSEKIIAVAQVLKRARGSFSVQNVVVDCLAHGLEVSFNVRFLAYVPAQRAIP